MVENNYLNQENLLEELNPPVPESSVEIGTKPVVTTIALEEPEKPETILPEPQKFSVQQPPEEIYDLSDQPQQYVFTGDTIPHELQQNRAMRYAYALQILKSPGSTTAAIGTTITPENIASVIGVDESFLKQHAANLEELNLRQEKEALISDLIRQFGPELTPKELQFIRDLSAREIKLNPEVILPHLFARQYVSDSISRFPEQTLENSSVEIDTAIKIATINEYLRQKFEDLVAKYNQQGYVTTAADYISRYLIPGITPFFGYWWRESSLFPDKPSVAWMPGGTRESNAVYWLNKAFIDFDSAQKELDKAIEYLEKRNLVHALEFVQTLMEYSTNEKYLDNFFAAITTATWADVLKIPRMAGAIGRAARKSVVGEPQPRTSLAKPAEQSTETTAVDTAKPAQESVVATAPQPETPKEPVQLELPMDLPRIQRQLELPMEMPHVERHVLPKAYNPARTPFETMVRHFRGIEEKKLRELEWKKHEWKQLEIPFEEQLAFRFSDIKTSLTDPDKSRLITGADVKHPGGGPPDIPSAESPEVRQQLKDALSVLKSAEIDIAQAADAMGRKDAALIAAVSKTISNVSQNKPPPHVYTYPTGMNPMAHHTGDSLTVGPVLKGAMEEILKKYKDLPRITRLSPEEFDAAVQAHKLRMLDYYKSTFFDTYVVDWSITPPEESLGRLATLNVKLTSPYKPLTTVDEAEQLRIWLKLAPETAKPVFYKGEYVLEISESIPEVGKAIRDVYLPESYRTHQSLMTSILGSFRTPDEFLGKEHSRGRIITTHIPKKAFQIIDDAMKSLIKSMSKKEIMEMDSIIKSLNSQQLTSWPNIVDIEREFFNKFNKLPTTKQIQYYEDYVLLNDFHYTLYSNLIKRDMARHDAQHYRIPIKSSWSDWFAGIVKKELPREVEKGDIDPTFAFISAKTDQVKILSRSEMTPKDWEFYDSLVEKGYKTIQIFFPQFHEIHPYLKTLGVDTDKTIHYLVVRDAQRADLMPEKILGYRPGPHRIVKHEFYVSQPIIEIDKRGQKVYAGDKNILVFPTEAEAKEYALRLNEALELYRLNKIPELDVYVQKYLPWSLQDFLKVIKSYGTNVDFYPRHKQQLLIEAHEEISRLVDVNGFRSVHNPSSALTDRSFFEPRDTESLKTIVEGHPLRLIPAEEFSPIEALQTSLNRAINNTWGTEYKIFASEHWVKEFGHILDPLDIRVRSPAYILRNAKYQPNAPFETKQAAEKSRIAILALLDEAPPLLKTVDYLKAKLEETIYKTAGQKAVHGIEKLGETTTNWGLGSIKNPVTFMRSLASHFYLGFFNPVQFFMNAQMFGQVLATSPKYAVKAVAGAYFARAYLHNPQQLNTLASKAAKFGWDPEHFKIMAEGLERSGLPIVSKETSYRDMAEHLQLHKNPVGMILDRGMLFFNAGERIPRYIAWALSYLENKKIATPLTDAEFAKILNRQDDLTVNMTRKSLANIQQGAMGLTTQFYNFSMRMLDLLWGKRLTPAEKLRITTYYSILYGLPIGTGIWVTPIQGAGNLITGWLGPDNVIPTPSYDDVKQALMRLGIKADNVIAKTIMEGVMHTALAFVLGREYNVTRRYGPADSPVRNLFTGDTGFFEFLIGAGGTAFEDSAKSIMPSVAFMWQALAGGETGKYTKDDLLGAFRNIRTVDLATKAYLAAQYHMWYTRNNTPVGPADNLDAIMGILGLTRQEYHDAFLSGQILRMRERAQQNIENEAVKFIITGYRYAMNGDYDTARAYFTRANALMDFGKLSISQRLAVYRRVTVEQEPLVSRKERQIFEKFIAPRLFTPPEQREK
ncbi:MAG: hypothetical protein QXY94_03710 [Archaeoglobaceae archaeon]